MALILIGGMVLVGFVLEGMRIAMTGFPEGAVWAFLGYAVAKLCGQGGYLVDLYGYVWYLHAVLAGAFLAYIPFSRLFHIIVGPLVLAGNAVRDRQDAVRDRQDAARDRQDAAREHQHGRA
jgi:nitrate reductase gamma subunit